jgi:hypothetical protein
MDFSKGFFLASADCAEPRDGNKNKQINTKEGDDGLGFRV